MNHYVEKSRQVFNLEQWSNGYFDINFEGQLGLKVKDKIISFNSIVDSALEKGAHFPLLLRFNHILLSQLNSLRGSFAQVSSELEYSGEYLPVYPIKVNQQADVVKTLAADSKIGLEAGSKPELLLVTAYSQPGQVIICNGYKDKQFIELASWAHSMGQKVFVVIEKPFETQMLLSLHKKKKTVPNFGVRVRLSSVGSSHWQNTGGQRSKFGLNSIETWELIKQLKQENLLEKLKLLHFHIGSQIANIRDIRSAIKEASQWYRRLRELGAPIETIDIGGGLGIDYLGTSNRHEFSKNYNFDEYARAVIQPLKDICQSHCLPMPNIMSESGRAFTAHHAVLVTNILSVESHRTDRVPECQNHYLLKEYEHVLNKISQDNVVESYHEGRSIAAEVDQHFIVGDIDLAQKAYSLYLGQKLFQNVRSYLTYEQRQHREIIDDINQADVQKVLCNMSVFQSIPDAWAIGQIFPIMPLSNLDKPLTCRSVLHDLTCDSDGQVKDYGLEDGVESSTLLPKLSDNELKKTYMGFFLVGAYQETLGDIHNLFGDQDSLIVDIDGQGSIKISDCKDGQDIRQIIGTVGYNSTDLKEKITAKAQHLEGKHLCFEFIEAVLDNNTYLADDAFSSES